MNDKTRRYILAYALPIVIILLAWLGTRIMIGSGEFKNTYMVFMLGVVLSAWYGGLGPAIFATALSVIIVASQFLMPGNSTNWIDSSDTLRLIAFSLVALIVGYLSDEKHRAVASEREKRNWLQVLVASIGDGVIVTNERGEIVLLNAVAEKLLGWSQKEALGKRLEDVFHTVNELTNMKIMDPVARVLEEGRIVGMGNHTLLIARDGSRIPIDDSASPIQDIEGKLIGVVLIFRSDLERRSKESELAKLA